MTIQNQDGVEVTVKVDDDGEVAKIYKGKVDGATLVAETVDGDEVVIGVFADMADAKDALKELNRSIAFVPGGMTAKEWLEIQEYEGSLKGLNEISAVEYLNN